MSVFENEKTVFFKTNGPSATDNASGCLQTWWDAAVESVGAAAAKLKLMSGPDNPIVDDVSIDYDVGTDRFELTGAAAAGVEAGMLVRATVSGGELQLGVYEISEVGTDYFMCVDLDWDTTPQDDTVEITIGGAFETIREVLSEVDASNHSVTIYANHIDPDDSTIVFDAGGDITKNTFLRLIGFKVAPGDMNYGGDYYESPVEILQNDNIDATKTVLIFMNNPYPVFELDADNIIIENFHLTATGSVTAILYTNAPKNIVFRNCRVSECWNVATTEAYGVLFDSCYADTASHQFYVPSGSVTLLGCVGEVAAAKNYLYLAIGGLGTMVGCIVIGGQRGVLVITAGKAFVLNNTFYNCSEAGVYVTSGGNVVVVNNIFALEAGVGAIGLNQLDGSFLYHDYNCYIETDGTPLTVGGSASYEAPIIGPHSIEVDPLFVDAANGNFQPQEPLVIDGGRPDSVGGWSTIGAYDYSANRGLSKSRVIGGV